MHIHGCTVSLCRAFRTIPIPPTVIAPFRSGDALQQVAPADAARYRSGRHPVAMLARALPFCGCRRRRLPPRVPARSSQQAAKQRSLFGELQERARILGVVERTQWHTRLEASRIVHRGMVRPAARKSIENGRRRKEAIG